MRPGLGDRFLLGAFSWQIVNITRDRVLVRPCDAGGAQSPFWRGDGMGRPYETGLLFGRYWRELEDAARAHRLESALVPFALSPDGRANAARRVRDQLDALGALPTDRAILAEHFSSEDGGESLLFHQRLWPPGQPAAGAAVGRSRHRRDGRARAHALRRRRHPFALHRR